jgi:hypothetical protein
MANVIGNSGEVLVSTNQVAEVVDFSMSKAVNVADDTVIGDTWQSHKTGTQNWSGSVNCFWDKTDTTAQGAMTIGASVDLHLIPEGSTAGNIDFNGTVTITGIEMSTANDSIVTANFSFQGNGALTEDTLT